ncbi:MAG: RNase adaptor protein RapZ, partial [Oscillospiraceae bacterium]|nr:RNase adaptor protein RapZ [Oscillospiraceae bacterium]
MQLVIVTGMSGSGKSTIMKVMEDIGFYCIDNLPPELIPEFIEISKRSGITNIAISADIRTGGMFSEIYNVIHDLRHSSADQPKVIF